MSWKNWELVANEPVDIQDFMEFVDHFRGIYRIYLKWITQIRMMSTCNQSDLESLGSWPNMPKNLQSTLGDFYEPNKEILIYMCQSPKD